LTTGLNRRWGRDVVGCVHVDEGPSEVTDEDRLELEVTHKTGSLDELFRVEYQPMVRVAFLILEADIAAAMGVRPGTVKALLHQGIDELRKVIEP
jgi:hypothetical protein